MTIERDFDRIARAWLDLGPNEAPDRSVAAVLQAIETTPQVRRPIRWPAWRPITMTRITMLAVLAGTIAILAGALFLTGGGPAPAPSITPPPSTAAAGPLPEAVMGGWTAASRGTAIEDPEVTTMLLGPSSRDTFATPFSIDRPGFVRSLGSNVIEESPGVLRFTLSNPGEANCELRDVGTYRWSKSADGQWLTLDRIADACEIRGQILPGTWQQNVGFSTDGGPGIAVNFKPFLAFTLPAGSWNGNEFADSDTIAADVPTATFKVWKDLDGFVDPCDIDKGVRPIDPGMDAFLEYLETDPRFNVVRRDEYTIDGHRAVEVEFSIGPNIEPPCWAFDGNEDDRRGVLTWVPESWSGGFYNAPIRSRDILVVTEVDGATLTFEAVNAPNGLLEADRETLDTVRFLQELPAPPAS